MREKILNLIMGETGRRTIIVAFGNLANAFFSIVFVYLSSKILSAFEFGLFSICLTTWFLLQELTEMGLGNLTIRLSAEKLKENKREAQIYFKINILIRLILGILIFSLFVFFGRFFTLFLRQPKLMPLFLIVSFFEIFAFLLIGLTPVIFVSKKFLLYTLVLALQGILRLVFLFLLVFLRSLNLFSVLLVFVGMPFLSLLLVLLFIEKDFLKVKLEKKYFLLVFNSLKWLALYGVFLSFANRVSPYILTKERGPVEAGIYNLAYLFSSVFLLLTTAFSSVFLPKISQLREKSEMIFYFKKAFGVFLLLGLLMLASIFPGQIFLKFFLEGKYSGISISFIILTIGMIFTVFSVPAINILWILNKPKSFALISFLQLLFILILNLILIKIYGLIGAAVTFSFVSFFICCLFNYFVVKSLKITYEDF